MQIRDVLVDLKQLYIDTAPLIYYVEENPTYVEKMEAVFQFIEDNSLEVISSVITLTEVLQQPIQQSRTDLQQKYLGILLSSNHLALLPVDAATAESAAHLRARYNLRTPDALHVATALKSQCEAFLTNDIGLKRVTELRILVLDELE
ncbi:MAG: type II toxin-antitoxin system VapC family toxin [Chloroflexi bacterium]|nr:type II toxin-antitoxin system VapC family toxin [Chloroflexota bacterium]